MKQSLPRVAYAAIAFFLVLFTKAVTAQNVGIGTNTPEYKLDIRGADPDDGISFSIGNSTNTHRMQLYGGRVGDPDPFMGWRQGGRLRFATDENGFRELMSLSSNGNMMIGPGLPNTAALLDMQSNAKGLLIPRMSLAERNAITNPPKGLMVFVNTDNNFHYYNGSAWTSLTSAGDAWLLGGNAGTDTSKQFIGTTDSKPLLFRVNNQRAGIISDGGSIGLGIGALNSNTTGEENIAFGTNALQQNTSGKNNIANGTDALYSNTTGGFNVATGFKALVSNTTGGSNIAIGSASLYSNISGHSNVSIGAEAMGSNLSGYNNVSLGPAALYINKSGSYNVAVGVAAMQFNRDKSGLVAVGDSTLYRNGTGAGEDSQGIENTAIGSKALYNNTTGSSNTATGFHSLIKNTTGYVNTAIGSFALAENTTGVFNTANGDGALSENITGSSNTAMGTDALSGNTTGSNNTAIGVGADVNSANLNNATAIGAYAKVNCSGCLVLGRDDINVGAGTLVGIGTSNPTTKLHVVGTAKVVGAGIFEGRVGINKLESNVTLNIRAAAANQSILNVADFAGTSSLFSINSTGNINTAGNVFVDGGLSIDQKNINSGSYVNGLRFGSNSFEAIASKRTAGSDQYGLDFYTDAIKRMAITNSGDVIAMGNLKVGNGVVVDEKNLNNGSVSNGIQFGNIGDAGIGSKRNGNPGNGQFSLAFYTKFLERMTVTVDGNVGIGTSSPSAKLAVLGSIYVSSAQDIIIPDGEAFNVSHTDGIGHFTERMRINSSGNVNFTGTISKGGGSFKIDHPLDPYNKFLYHSFVESPDMMNVYNGNITTDDKGEAVVEMPDWFETLNRDFRYQLTVIGEFAQAIVGDKLANNRFSIKTDKPGIEVSWQITGIRKDSFANENRIPVEEDKEGADVGKLLYPPKNAAAYSKN